MKNRLVTIPNPKSLIKASPGFAKKKLSDSKIDLMGLCSFGCRYCSSNNGHYLRINRARFAAFTEEQLGERVVPDEDPSLSFVYTDVMKQLESELRGRKRSWGAGKVLVLSMLTDAFSPVLLTSGVTRAVLELLLDRTSFRLRILTKNAIVGSPAWIEFFAKHRDRLIVGLSTGTLDDRWSQEIEVGTSLPSARLRALRALQDAEIPTYGMLCPIFPGVMEDGQLDELIDAVNPEACEHVWAEPYNNRQNWRRVQSAYAEGSPGWEWLERMYGQRVPGSWSQYATTLYQRLRARSDAEGWTSKLRYMLYEDGVTSSDAATFSDMAGLMLQSPANENGGSKSEPFARLQAAAEISPGERDCNDCVSRDLSGVLRRS